LATEARPAFIAITGQSDASSQIDPESRAAALRFAACLREASGDSDFHPLVVACSTLAARAFGGDGDAWAPLVAAVRLLLARLPAATARSLKPRRELRAFVAENADLLDAC
jgi:hypothetical protein